MSRNVLHFSKSLTSSLTEDSWILISGLHLICYDNIHHVAPGKLSCIIMGKWEGKKILWKQLLLGRVSEQVWKISRCPRKHWEPIFSCIFHLYFLYSTHLDLTLLIHLLPTSLYQKITLWKLRFVSYSPLNISSI